jgi:hypothetical protein
MKNRADNLLALRSVRLVAVSILAMSYPSPASIAQGVVMPVTPAVGGQVVTLQNVDWSQTGPPSMDVDSGAAPWLRLQRAAPTAVSLYAAASLATTLDSGTLTGIGLAHADFDADGRSDLVCGYDLAGSGVVTMQLGQMATNGKAPFTSHASAFETPVAPELMATGDFDADGANDLVVARRGDNALYFLRGTGRSRFAHIRKHAVDGRITELTSGDVDCRDGLTDLAIGVLTDDGPRIAVLSGPQGAMAATPDLTPVHGTVRALEVGDVTEGPGIDIVALTDAGLVAIAGFDSRVVWHESRPVTLRHAVDGVSLAIERTAQGRAAFTVADGLGDAVTCIAEPRAAKRAWQPRSDGRLAERGLVGGAKITSLPGGDLIAFAPGLRRLAIVSPVGGPPVWVELPEQVAAVLPLRLNADALDDLVVLYESGAAPDVLLTAPQNTYVVTTTNNDGPGSLAAAIWSANASPGADAVHFAIPGTAPFYVNWAMMNVQVTEALTIDATTQPGYAGSPLVQLNGNRSGFGLTVTSGSSVVRGLAINDFSAAVSLETNGGNVLEGNYFGLGVDGETSMGNLGFGLYVNSSGNTIGGTSPQARNIISGNGASGVYIGPGTSDNVVWGNYIGTNAAGTAPRPNGQNGVELLGTGHAIGGTAPGAGNVISGNTRSGVYCQTYGPTTIQGNIVGLTADGVTAVGNGYIGVYPDGSETLIGGSTSAARNVISANRYGVLANADDCLIQGNYIGTDAAGTLDRGNEFDGIEMGGQFCSILDNLISGNDRNGVGTSVHQSYLLIRGNRIGTDALGTAPVPNTSAGVRVDGEYSTVEENTIAFNGTYGILVFGGGQPKYNGFHRNSIFSNWYTGIELVHAEANDPRDADGGPNFGQNYPVLRSAVVDATGTTITGILTSAPGETFTVELYSSPEPTSVVRGDAKTYLGATSVSTNGVGRADFSVRLPLVPGGHVVSATATDSLENTSEISPLSTATTSAPDPARDAVGVYVPSSAAWFLRNTATPGSADVVFGYGPPGMTPLAGDWDGTLSDTAGIYDSNSSAFFLHNTNTGGSAESVFAFGAAGAGFVPLAGDWDGDGITTIALYQASTGTFFLRNFHAPGAADVVFTFGAGGSLVAIAGDWDGDGVDSVGVYSPATGAFFLTNDLAPGPADLVFTFGPPGGTPVTGDWDGDGDDSVGVYFASNAVWFLTNSHAPGPADVSLVYGPPGARPVTGNWDGL